MKRTTVIIERNVQYSVAFVACCCCFFRCCFWLLRNVQNFLLSCFTVSCPYPTLFLPQLCQLRLSNNCLRVDYYLLVDVSFLSSAAAPPQLHFPDLLRPGQLSNIFFDPNNTVIIETYDDFNILIWLPSLLILNRHVYLSQVKPLHYLLALQRFQLLSGLLFKSTRSVDFKMF